MGHQHAFDVNANLSIFCPTLVEISHGFCNDFANVGFHFNRVFFRNHATIKFETDSARNHVGVGAAFNAPHIQIGVVDAFYF